MPKISLICVLVFFLISCGSLTDDEGVFRDRKYDYKKATTTPRIEIPEGLDSEAIIDYYVIPPINPYAQQESFDRVPLPVDMVGQADSSVKIQKLGDAQWILLQVPASRVWPRLKEFISQEGLSLTIENNTVGIIETASVDGIYRFQLTQGFQRNTSELAIRYLLSSSNAKGFWPDSSSDTSKEYEMLEKIANFFADVSDKPAYSFAAQGISTQKKLSVETLPDGRKTLLLNVAQKRALVAVKLGLERAGFTIQDFDSANDKFIVRYTPPVNKEHQPGKIARFFGRKTKPFDEDVEYAGNRYFLKVNQQGDEYQVVIHPLDDETEKAEVKLARTDEKLLRKELNKQILLLKGHLH